MVNMKREGLLVAPLLARVHCKPFTVKTAGFHCVRFPTVVSLYFLQCTCAYSGSLQWSWLVALEWIKLKVLKPLDFVSRSRHCQKFFGQIDQIIQYSFPSLIEFSIWIFSFCWLLFSLFCLFLKIHRGPRLAVRDNMHSTV